MEKFTIKEEEIELEEVILDIKEEKNVLQGNELCQEVTESYEQEIKIEKHEFMEDSNCYISNSKYPKDDNDTFYPICKKLKSDNPESAKKAEVKKKYSLFYLKFLKSIKLTLKVLINLNCKTKPFECSICDYLCVRKSHMTCHVRAVYNKEKPFICCQCDYSCAHSSQMTVHGRPVHNKEKPFKCSECDYSCAQKSHMTCHVIEVHDKQKPFKCSECDYYCAQKSSMTMHVRAVHNKVKPFKCSKCEYSCARKSDMTAHVRQVHNKEKPFQCSKCDYSCALKSSMTRHVIAVQNKEKPIKCSECDVVTVTSRVSRE